MRLTGPPSPRVLVAILVAGGLAGLLLFGRVTPIESYRVDDDGRLIVTTMSGGHGQWNRIADVGETGDGVVVTVRTASLPVLIADIGVPAELVVALDDPLGERTVFDASSGQPIPSPPRPGSAE